MTAPAYAFCFVLQQGKLEIQGVLLALSLIENVGCTHEIFAALPLEYGDILPQVKETLEDLGVTVFRISNQISHDYPIGNKFSCVQRACELSSAPHVIFLDTDIMCNRPFHSLPGIENYDLSMRIAGFASWKDESQWEPIYRLFSLPLPEERLLSLRTKEIMLPYFNAGFIGLHSKSEFPQVWLETAKVIYDKYSGKRNSLHWLDQIAAPVAMQRLGLSYQCVSTKYNSTPDSRDGAIFQHYHNFRRLLEEIPQCRPSLHMFFKCHPWLRNHLFALMERE